MQILGIIPKKKISVITGIINFSIQPRGKHDETIEYITPPPPLARLAALLLAVLALPVANANTTNGMIDGNYAKSMPSYYLHKHLRPGVARVCVQITSNGTDRLTGTVKTRGHSGNWTLRRTVSLEPDSGAFPASTRDLDGNFIAHGGRENCRGMEFKGPGFPWGTQPTNWCGARRSIKPAHGWTGKLIADASELRVQARDHILNMPGQVGLRHGSTCP